MRKLVCRDAGFDCEAVIEAESDQAVLAQAAPHAEHVHGVEVTPPMAEELATKIRDA